MSASAAAEARFWRVASPLLDHPAVTRSTMMGFPCLRYEGDFFATYDHRTGDLVVKLDEERVGTLVDTGAAMPFAPAGRRFREWAAISPRRVRSWTALLDDALAAATARRASATPKRVRKRAR